MALAPRRNSLHEPVTSFMPTVTNVNYDSESEATTQHITAWESELSDVPSSLPRKNQDHIVSVIPRKAATCNSQLNGQCAGAAISGSIDAGSAAAAQRIIEEKFEVLNQNLIATREYALATIRHMNANTGEDGQRSTQRKTVRTTAGVRSAKLVSVIPIPPDSSEPTRTQSQQSDLSQPHALMQSEASSRLTMFTNNMGPFSKIAPWMQKVAPSRTVALGIQSASSPGAKKVSARRGIFGDAETLKAQVRLASLADEYNVFDCYKDSGRFQKIARSSWFENVTLIVIFLNAVWIGVDCEFNEESVITKTPAMFQVTEHFFCTYFFFEWLIRLCSFRDKVDALKDRWFVFDSLMLLTMVLETWIVSIIFWCSTGAASEGFFANSTVLRLIRVIRLCRVARVARLLNAMPEIMILVKGAVVAARSVFCTLALLGVIMYVFAIAFVQLTRGAPVGDAYFSSLLAAMKTLLLNGTFLEDIPETYYMVAAESEFLGVFLLCYIFVASLTVMNMLIGVLVEVVSVVAAVEKESLVCTYVKHYLTTLWDDSGLGSISNEGESLMSQEEFCKLLQHPDTTKCLSSVGVDAVALVDLGSFIFRDGQVEFDNFIDTVLTLRGSLQAKVKDLVDFRKFMIMELEDLEYRNNLRQNAMLDHVKRVESVCERLAVQSPKTLTHVGKTHT